MATQAICKIDDCDKPVKARGWCRRHYERWQAHGSPSGGGTAKGQVTDWVRTHSGHRGDACLRWPFRARSISGYATMRWRGRSNHAHIVMCTLAHGPRPTPKHEVAHACGKGHEGCINPMHLRWATRSANHADRVAHGTSARGEKSGTARLTEADVTAIRRRLNDETQTSLAREFGVSLSLVSLIAQRKRWAWLK